ncbi:MAG: hypothetical protein HFJ24_08180 [Clostridia bacterium]|nr:hypothetical protein [Clostridia bacterium]
MEGKLDLENIKDIKRKKDIHIPSKIQADTLFTFCTKLEYLKSPIKSKMISPRYCKEDIKYLNIPKLRQIAFPMKCFCDINMHKLDEHLWWYGYYGIGLTKEWGMKNGIQPIQYINPSSPLKNDFKIAFSNALKIKKHSQTKNEIQMKNYLLHQLMYFKPYSGKMENRNTGKKETKCFTDECEWRYVPDVSKIEYKQIYYNENIYNAGILNDLSISMEENPNISLKFEFDDLKYIIVKTKEDFEQISKFINKMDIKIEEKELLLSKTLIWELSGGDF